MRYESFSARRGIEATSSAKWHREFRDLMKENWRSWACLAVLAVLYSVVSLAVTPFDRFVIPSGWEKLEYPHNHSTVPSYLVPVFGVAIPVALAILYHVMYGCDRREFHDLLFSILVNAALTALATDALKQGLGRHRPDFFERCYGDSSINSDSMNFNPHSPPECTGSKKELEEGRKSFPSGHASWTMCSMFYITLFLIGKMKVFDGRGHVWKLVVSVLPTCFAVFVGITRINDYKHHWTDVVAGWLLGVIVGMAIYLMYYPCPFARRGTATPLYKLLQQEETQRLRNGTVPEEGEEQAAMEEGRNVGTFAVESPPSK